MPIRTVCLSETEFFWETVGAILHETWQLCHKWHKVSSTNVITSSVDDVITLYDDQIFSQSRVCVCQDLFSETVRSICMTLCSYVASYSTYFKLLLCCKLPKLLRECDDVINWWRHHLIWWSEAECVFVNSFSRRLSSWIARNFAVILRVTQLSARMWWHHQLMTSSPDMTIRTFFQRLSFSRRLLYRFAWNSAVMLQVT